VAANCTQVRRGAAWLETRREHNSVVLTAPGQAFNQVQSSTLGGTPGASTGPASWKTSSPESRFE
jgi:hypothetical protein